MSTLTRSVLALLALGLLAAPLAAAPPPRIDGSVMIGESVTHLRVEISRGGVPLGGLKVKVAGRLADEQGAGHYVLLVQEALAGPGRPLQVTIEQPVAAGPPLEPVTAPIVVAPWTRITEPADETHVGAAASGVPIAWSGGTAPYRLTARPEAQPGEVAFDESGIATSRRSIPMASLKKWKRVLVNVGFEPGAFSFAGPVQLGSRLVLIERSKPLHLNVD
ncbi:MAG: hypothetical protein HY825_04735 [Acidobacteria bacterium]|nr:hypothetical protein [Acidobacteriota bacterium]